MSNKRLKFLLTKQLKQCQMSNRIELIKSEESNLLDLNDGKGIMTAYILTFNKEDKENDENLPGSFNRTIKNNLKQIFHAWMHDASIWLGFPIGFTADSYGLIVESQFNMEKQFSKDVFSDYKLAHSLGRSIGHSARFISINPVLKQNGGHITSEAILKEYSTVAFPADVNAQSLKVKSELNFDVILSNIEKMANLPYSDTTKQNLETIFNTIQKSKSYGSLILPGSLQTPGNKVTPLSNKEFEQFLNKLNNL